MFQTLPLSSLARYISGGSGNETNPAICQSDNKNMNDAELLYHIML